MSREEEYKKELIINNIIRKLEVSNILTPYEFHCVNTALRRANDLKQIPYYEVVYHDEYDKTEHRVMEPVNVTLRDDGHIKIRQDRFELNFNRMLL